MATVLVLPGAWDTMVEFMEAPQVPVRLVLVDVQLEGALVVQEEVVGQEVVVEVPGVAGLVVAEPEAALAEAAVVEGVEGGDVAAAAKSSGLFISSSRLPYLVSVIFHLIMRMYYFK
jgi:hypothetical protein